MDQCFIRDQFACLTASHDEVLEAAALLETFDLPALSALLDEPIAAIPPELIAAGIVCPAGPQFRLDPAVQADMQQGLQQAPERQRRLTGRAATHYARRLMGARPQEQAALETLTIRYVNQYCELLIQQEPTGLADALAALPLDAVKNPHHEHLLRYYRGLGLGLVEQYAAARTEFRCLLGESALDDALRARVLNSEGTFARLQGDYQRAR